MAEAGADTVLEGLNAAQREAVLTGSSHNLVLAGAGTGKTTTIVARLRHQLRQGVSPERLLAITFTRRAAAEIRSRVQAEIGVGGAQEGVAAMTFHGWAMRHVRNNPDVFGYEGWSVLDAEDQAQVMRGVVGRGKRVEGLKADQIVDVLSFARNTRITLAEAIRVKHPDQTIDAKAVGAIVRAFEERKRERQYLNYDDILMIFAERLKDPAVAAWVGSHYEEILVDEMQDTNPLQWLLIDPLVPHTRFYCVGDDAQSIYGFRGADFASIHSFRDRVPGARVLKLEDNYRSTQEILDLSNWLLDQSPLGYDKHLRAVRGSGAKPELHSFETPQDEAGWIAAEMMRARDDGQPWATHLILVRSNYSGRAIEARLVENDIPYVFYGGVKLLESAHVRDVLSALRVVSNPDDEIAWMRLLTLLPRVGDRTAARVFDDVLDARGAGLSAREARERALKGLPGWLAAGLDAIEEASARVDDAVGRAASMLTPVLAHKYRNDNWDARSRDLSHVERLAASRPSISAFIEEYLLSPVFTSELSQDRSDGDHVIVSTVHSAKGLERDWAFCAGVSAGAYPSARSLGDVDSIEEERRVLYVALTRARDRLIVTRTFAHTPVRAWVSTSAGLGFVEDAYFLGALPEALVREEVHTAARLPKPVSPPGAGVGGPREIDLGVDLGDLE
ncbi:ATP-dependent helicase [Demequina sp. SYSU T00039]|uniref:DNA 3'-5' helicase n=1 Tax=Demequina lignilytica TaxID=3051663 RepID=A0AAW7M040_9MICO|nr:MULTISPECIES: ATP-dependent helicase [unclassified Demequina]MDN4477325.1 ATP-dependent helicase [Demequina sp. SYSU T00039-1]MDN4487498.1 ATP-dependent helicase [Demequina sp. SYSU T00039]